MHEVSPLKGIDNHTCRQSKVHAARAAILWQRYSTKIRMYLLCFALPHPVVGQRENVKLHLQTLQSNSLVEGETLATAGAYEPPQREGAFN